MHPIEFFLYEQDIVFHLKKKQLYIYKKLITSNYAPFETIQLWSEILFNIIKNKQNILDDSWLYVYMVLPVSQVDHSV